MSAYRIAFSVSARVRKASQEDIHDLEAVWQANTGFIADQSDFLQDQTTPIYVDGTLYQCTPAGQITALNGTTGDLAWVWNLGNLTLKNPQPEGESSTLGTPSTMPLDKKRPSYCSAQVQQGGEAAHRACFEIQCKGKHVNIQLNRATYSEYPLCVLRVATDP